MEACMRTIEKLNRLNKSRPDPADTLINIAEVCQGCDLNDEGWTNFYSYITTSDRSTWQYLTDIPTLGDLSEEHLAKIEEDLQKQVSDVGVMHKSYENGIETFVDVKYFDPIIDKENGEQVARFCETVQEETSRTDTETVFEGSERGVQEDEKRPS